MIDSERPQEMNEIGRDYSAAKALGTEGVLFLLKLWFVVMMTLAGLWVLGVILMFWKIIVPLAIIVLLWILAPNGSPPTPEDGLSAD